MSRPSSRTDAVWSRRAARARPPERLGPACSDFGSSSRAWRRRHARGGGGFREVERTRGAARYHARRGDPPRSDAAEATLSLAGTPPHTHTQVYERLDELDSDNAEARAAQLLAGLGFDVDMQAKPTRDYSGGWRMRIALAQALFVQPDLLLLDEPTNHLDVHALTWLEVRAATLCSRALLRATAAPSRRCSSTGGSARCSWSRTTAASSIRRRPPPSSFTASGCDTTAATTTRSSRCVGARCRLAARPTACQA